MSFKICLPARRDDQHLAERERICVDIPILIEPRRPPKPGPPELIDLTVLATIAALVESVSPHEGIRDELADAVERSLHRMAAAMPADVEVHRAEIRAAA